jgi:hypothetical protein
MGGLAEAVAEQYWLKPAQRVYADTRREDVVAASRFQLALREIMSQRQAQAIAIDCLGALTAPKMDKEGYPCLGFSALEDEGWVTSCQCDIDCALTKMIVRCAFDLPSFLGNVYFDTGKTLSVVRNVGLKGMLFYAAKIIGNPEGTCRTTVELEPDGRTLTPTNYQPIGACAGLHHVACLGKYRFTPR